MKEGRKEESSLQKKWRKAERKKVAYRRNEGRQKDLVWKTGKKKWWKWNYRKWAKIPCYLSTSTPCYLSTSTPCYLSTSKPSYLSTSTPCYLSTSTPCYLSTSTPCYLSTFYYLSTSYRSVLLYSYSVLSKVMCRAGCKFPEYLYRPHKPTTTTVAPVLPHEYVWFSESRYTTGSDQPESQLEITVRSGHYVVMLKFRRECLDGRGTKESCYQKDFMYQRKCTEDIGDKKYIVEHNDGSWEWMP